MNLIEIAGSYYDEETGEYAGPVKNWFEGPIDSEEKALVVMRLLLEAQTEVDATQAQMNAIVANCERMIKQKQSKIDWLQVKYKAQLAEWVKEQLPRDKDGILKKKTWVCPFGSWSWRKVKETVKVKEGYSEQAIAWLEENAPDAVKVTKSILVSQLPAEAKQNEMFEVIPEREVATMKAGV